MSRPPKPFTVIQNEGKSHRTKSELKQRKQGEESLATGIAIKERPEVKSNPIAHKEFRRVNDLLQKIQKNDAIYEVIINRYCIMVAECTDMQVRRDDCYNIAMKMHERFEEDIEKAPPEEQAKLIRQYARIHSDLLDSLVRCDMQIQSKRKMLLDIEKENIMTIAAALRSIPKKEESKGPSLADILKNG